jgi:hypothetical protein
MGRTRFCGEERVLVRKNAFLGGNAFLMGGTRFYGEERVCAAPSYRAPRKERMVLFSLSDLLISCTLLLNAIALISSSPKKNNILQENYINKDNLQTSSKDSDIVTKTFNNEEKESNNIEANVYTTINNPVHAESMEDENSEVTIGERFQMMMRTIRRYSCIIVLWNIIFALLMILVLPG